MKERGKERERDRAFLFVGCVCGNDSMKDGKSKTQRFARTLEDRQGEGEGEEGIEREREI